MLQRETIFSELGQRGTLVARLAASPEEVTASQRLRFRVFYEEMAARADEEARVSRLDRDRFDSFCDHLLVVNTAPVAGPGAVLLSDGELVGCYRLLRQGVAEEHGGFYTQGEFDIDTLVARKPELKFLELGRSCVLKEHRSKPVVELLWQGIWNYVRMHELDVMIGCASLEGTDPDQQADTLSLLAYNASPPAEWQVRAQSTRYVEMKRRPRDSFDQKRALVALPPLIKGYLRLGCFIGDGAVIDHQFNTIDVLIILPVSVINPRYFEHFGKPNPA
jgi:L-ornithine Nalpha-acyltransferase